jgi:Cu-processing system permease protein
MLSIDFRQIAIVAGKEFWDRIRNRWVLAVALVFTAFALVIAYFGAAQQGAVGFRSIEVTIASLVSLVIYLIPLIALILGFDAVVGERERGSSTCSSRCRSPAGAHPRQIHRPRRGAGLLDHRRLRRRRPDPVAPAQPHRPLPLRRLHVLGDPPRPRLPEPRRDAVGVRRRPHPRLRPRHRHLVLLRAGLRPAAPRHAGRHRRRLRRRGLPYLLLLNPADVFRVLNVFTLDEVRTLYGLATVFPEALSNPTILGGVMLAWIVGPLAVAIWRFER